MAQAKAKATEKETAVEVKAEIQATKPQLKKLAELTTVSSRIRFLDSEGYSRSDITKLITNASGGKLRYQHVRNVLTSQAPKKAS